MRENINIDVHHLTRVEGHGNIVVRVEDGKLREARWDVVETPRYFEVMLKGKHYTTAGILTSRICGICSIGHCLASLRATENAFGVSIPEAARKLRLLAKHGETLQSHVLHVLFLAAPDFLDLPSVVPLIETNPEIVALAARLKALGNDLCDVVAGRTTHPISLQVGGVSRMPDRASLETLREKLDASLEDLSIVVGLMRTFQIPDFSRETEFVSLKAVDDYPFIGGRLISSDGVEMDEGSYEKMTNETVNRNNTSKWCSLSRESFAVGALARFNNNSRNLHAEALQVAKAMGLAPTSHNPYMNNVAQVVECVHCTHDAMRIIDELLDGDPGETMTPVTPRAGRGTSAVEVPRGILYHDYTYDGDGRIVKANCVIPTTQNNANIHHDLSGLVEQFAAQGSGKEELEKLCSMLVRAYDPCISCSVH